MNKRKQKGFSLLEMVLALAIMAIILSVATTTLHQATQAKAQPLIYARAQRLGQDALDAVMTRRFDENSPEGGVPHCGASGAPACAGIVSGDSGFDDVGDFNGHVDTTTEPPFVLNVAVVEAGAELSLTNNTARRVTVTVSLPASHAQVFGLPLTLSVYKFNY